MNTKSAFLKTQTAGLDDLGSCLSDIAILANVKKIPFKAKKISYLKSIIKPESKEVYSSKKCLIDLVKKDDPQLAISLSLALITESVDFPLGYIAMTEVALEHKAYSLALYMSRIAIWLSHKEFKVYLKDSHSLNAKVIKELSDSNDTSSLEMWKNLFFDRYYILEKLSHKLQAKKFASFVQRYTSLYISDNSTLIYVFRSLLGLRNKSATIDVMNYVQGLQELPQNKKDLFTGLTQFILLEPESSVTSLKAAFVENTDNSVARIGLFLNYFLKDQQEDLESMFSDIFNVPQYALKRLDELASYFGFTYVALMLLAHACLDRKIEIKEELLGKEGIMLEISNLFKYYCLYCKEEEKIKLLYQKLCRNNIEKILPDLNLYLIEVLIEERRISLAKELLSNISNNETHRLYAWIYRVEWKEELANKELYEYRMGMKDVEPQNKHMYFKVASYNLPDIIPKGASKIVDIVKDVYSQTTNIINQIIQKHGVNNSTCFDNGCADCCSKTFPMVTYTEYLYMKKWLVDQPIDFQEKIKSKSIKIVEDYKNKFNREPAYLSGNVFEKDDWYPPGYAFTCPFLSNNQCTVYEARPFICRAYGFSTSTFDEYKGCAYFKEQFQLSTALHGYRTALDYEFFNDLAEITDKHLIGRQVSAPIPLWFSRDHEETTFKAQFASFRNSWLEPLANLLVKIKLKSVKK